MVGPLFIGDELTAAGFRLAGARVLVPGAAVSQIEAALARERLVLIGAGTARRLEPDVLRAALRSLEPLVLVVPDATGAHPPDLAAETYRALDIQP
jgi:vacuolar-type H+-ATPase subunit F/Vma7